MKALLTALVLMCIASPAFALELGTRAPTLSAGTWINGDAVQPDKADGETTYVVEFWATWCPPCRQSIPHLNELFKQYKDKNVVLVGVTDEREEVVRPFVKKMDMEYLVAISSNQANAQWMQGIPGIPHAFIVNAKGDVVWSGHPMGGLDDALQGVLEGTYDIEQAKEGAKQEDELKNLLVEGDLEKALKKLDAMLAEDRKDFTLCQLKLELLAQTERFGQLRKFYGDIYESFSDSAEEMNTLAWIAATSPFEMCDLGIAWKAAHRAADLSKRENSAILDTLARVYYAAGLLDQAVVVQEEAIRKAEDKEERADMESALRFYKSAMALREEISKATPSRNP